MKDKAKGAYLKERTAFRSLLLANPNYFGNLKKSPLKPALKLTGNTHYEELACVGYQPRQKQLEAVVYIHQPSGYGTDVCGPGTPEYVRFYLSFDNGTTWQDQGMTSFQVFNIAEGTAGSGKLEYAASLPANPKRRFCLTSPLAKMRAILSWNNPPPAGQPDWAPIWGNVREETVVIEPWRFWFAQDLFELAEVELPKPVEKLLAETASQTAIKAEPKTLGVAELAELYRGTDVPAHRFAYREIAAFAGTKSVLSAEAFAQNLPGLELGPDIGDLLFPKTDGNVSFEELQCVGLDPNAPDTLVGVIQVKKPTGFSGGPCTNGSREYVTFWADFDGNGSFETCLGTADVRVYDVAGSPQPQMHYAVRLPVDLTEHRQPCQEGPKVVRIRAILSWNVPAPCANPNHVPAWGNRVETRINIAPAAQAPAGKIAILGGIPVSHIHDAAGLTTADAVFATNNLPPDPHGRPCPFARRVTVQGAPLPGHSYKAEVIPAGGGAPTAVVTKLILTRQDGTTHEHFADPVTGRFTYLNFTQNINGVLAQWDSTGDDLWQVRLSTYDAGGNLVGADAHRIQLDNTAPEADIEITSGAGNCGKFKQGDILAGNFVARDTYLRSYSLGILPAINPPGIGVPSPASGLVNTPAAPGAGWNLDTVDMKPCGYVIRVVAVDRAIVNSQSVGLRSSASAGFCLDLEE